MNRGGKMAEKVRRRRSRRGLSKFFTVWCIVFAAVAVVWAAGLLFVRRALEEYEATRPQYEAERIFEERFKNRTSEELAEYADTEVSAFEDEGSAGRYLAGLIGGGDLSYREVIGTDSTVKTYAVSSGDITFGSFTVGEGSEETRMFKFKYPELKGISVHLTPVYGVSVFAPALADVTVNGVKLDSGCTDGKPVILDDDVYFPEDNDEYRVMVNYAVAGLFETPRVMIKMPGRDGKTLEPAVSADGTAYDAELAYRSLLAGEYNETVKHAEMLRHLAELKKQQIEEAEKQAELEKQRLEEEKKKAVSDAIKARYGDFVTSMAVQYNKFIYQRTSAALRDATKVYFKSGTDIYRNVTQNYYNWSDYYPSSISFPESETLHYEWTDGSETAFRCDIKMTVKMYGRNSTSGQYYYDTEYFDMVAFVELKSGKPLCTALLSPEAAAEAGN